jgi:hypothetical protein
MQLLPCGYVRRQAAGSQDDDWIGLTNRQSTVEVSFGFRNTLQVIAIIAVLSVVLPEILPKLLGPRPKCGVVRSGLLLFGRPKHDGNRNLRLAGLA